MKVLIAIISILITIFIPYLIGKFFPFTYEDNPPLINWIEGLFLLIMMGFMLFISFGIYLLFNL